MIDQVVILAGGRGTRMRPMTDELPKVLLPVAGEPFAHHQLRLLRRQGFRRVVYCIGYRGDLVRADVGDGSSWDVAVEYVDDGDRRRGTGGALRGAHDAGLLDPAFAVLYGDSYLPIDVDPVRAAFSTSGAPALMTVYDNRADDHESNVVFRDGRVLLYEKGAKGDGMTHIDYGLSFLTREVVHDRVPPAGRVDLSDVQHELSVAGLLVGFEIDTRYFEIGSPQGLAALEAWLTRDERGSTGATDVE